MVLILLFPMAVLGAAVLLLLSRHRTGTWKAARGGPLLLLLTLLASYALAFAALNADPYYEDNGAAEFIEFRYRWTWAAVIGGLVSMFSVPGVFALRALWLWWRCRNARGTDGPPRERA
ncbi:hypothetical protein [Antarcticirhabdus aurantiaca]|uniref:Uncharacterized protein n=1 Tax=Antarcticirhabdus aurantiaca TaxID=2606717 RepID=A0ACD4NN47_9HYPH|nr:hypothetical protein [Antarcticirhabdus aurantiaca]WAJ28278.1 hypothetical protein OXU80_26255 [Jeongeuplla avenae]